MKALMIYLQLTSSFTPVAAPTIFGATVAAAASQRTRKVKAELSRMLV